MNKKLFLSLVLFGIAGTCICQSKQGVAEKNEYRGLPRVEEVDLARIDPSSFAVSEWYVPYYLKHFAQLANSVTDTGANRGFINIAVWRPREINKPFNARIMENILSLAWFYTKQRPWNVYYGDPALRLRLEAALNFWCDIQNSDGRFSEYSPGQWSLAPTAFATKFVGRALYLLHDGPAIDASVYARARSAWRKALYISFTDPDLWAHGKKYTNQYANLWGGALMYLKLWPDQEIQNLFQQRFSQSMEAFQSPCGFFYEAGGPDWGYDLSTHHSDLDLAWNFAKGTSLQDQIIEKMQRWYDWFSFNAVREPGSSFFYLNRAIETRQHHGYLQKEDVEDPASERGVPEAEFVPLARAFQLSAEEWQQSLQSRYDAMRRLYPRVAPLNEGEFWAFSPYAFLHDNLLQWHPSGAQKTEALAHLPYLEKKRFTAVRHDSLANTSYFFVKRPAYYAVFNAGKIVTPQERYGLGLVWNAATGSVLQSQSKTDLAAWGTKAAGQKQVFEASDLFPTVVADQQNWKPGAGIQERAVQSLVLTYPLGERGTKTVRFGDDQLVVDVNYPGAFTEVLPLLAGSKDALHVEENKIQLHTSSGILEIQLQHATGVETKAFDEDLGLKACRVIDINATGHLRYTLRFSPSSH